MSMSWCGCTCRSSSYVNEQHWIPTSRTLTSQTHTHAHTHKRTPTHTHAHAQLLRVIGELSNVPAAEANHEQLAQMQTTLARIEDLVHNVTVYHTFVSRKLQASAAAADGAGVAAHAPDPSSEN